jgi:hypothetical protein
MPIQGAYTFTMTVDPTCRDQFPRDFRVRTYDVDIKEKVGHSEIWFLNPDVHAFPHFDDPPGTGSVSGASYRLDFLFYDNPPSYTYVVDAAAVAPVPGPETKQLSGPLFADLAYTDSSRSAHCVSSSMSFNLTPR